MDFLAAGIAFADEFVWVFTVSISFVEDDGLEDSIDFYSFDKIRNSESGLALDSAVDVD